MAGKPKLAATAKPADLPPSITQMLIRWCELRSLISEFGLKLEDSKTRQMAEEPGTEEYATCARRVEFDAETSLRKVSQDIFENLIDKAEHFFGGGAKLDIDRDIQGDLWDGDPETLDIAASWHKLAARFDGDAGKNLALHQLAVTLMDELRIKSGEDVQQANGRFIVGISVWMDSYGRPNEISYNCRDKLQKIFWHLGQFADMHGRHGLTADLRRMDLRKPIVSREKHHFGDDTEIIITTYKTRFELSFSAEFGNELQCFLGMHLPHPQKRAA